MMKSRTQLGRTLACLLGVVLALAVCGCSKSRMSDERNPYYLRGLQLLEQDKYEDAAASFEKCLRLSPGSAKAHLQLGILYEDVFTDLPVAIFHYRSFLKKRPESENAEAVSRWLARAEASYLNDLLGRYAPATAARLLSSPATAPQPEEAPEVGPRPLSDREKKLALTVRQLNDEIAALQEQLRAARSETVSTPAAASGTGTPGPEEAAPVAAKRTYVVAKGDSLSSISRKLYGSLSLWPELQRANRELLGDGTDLKPGMVLKVPDLKKPSE